MVKKNRFIHNHTSESKLFFNSPSIFALNNLFYIQCFGYEDCTKGYFLERENFESFLIAYTIEGKGILNYNSKTYNLVPRTCFFIDCSKYQNYFNNSSENWKFCFVHFNGRVANAIYQKFVNINGPVFMGDESLLSLLKKPELIIQESSQFTEIYHSEIISSIISSIFRCSLSEQKNKITLIEKVIAYIENNFEKNITVNEIADRFYINSYYLQHLFKNTISYSIYEYILKLRLEKSQRLLVLSDYSVAEISEKVGFSSANNFIRFFKKKTGLTPMTFRKNQPHNSSN